MQVVITESIGASIYRVSPIERFPGSSASLFPGGAVRYSEVLLPVVDELIGNQVQVIVIRHQFIIDPSR